MVLVFYLKTNSTFYLTSYVIIAIMEIIGTHFGCWLWIDNGFGIFSFIPSANPPIGIPICYYLIPTIAYAFYFSIDISTWKRFIKIKKWK